MMKQTIQKGFAHLGLLLLMLIVAIIGFVGYKVASNRSNDNINSVSKSTAAEAIPQIKDKADLDTVEATLNNQNIDGNLNPDSLDQDIQSLL
jgi:hypothetical protein